MPVTHKNRLRCTISNTPSTSGALTISAASSGYRTFVAGDDAKTFDCVFVDGTAWEVRTGCTYTHSGTSLSRGTLEDSSTGSAISLTSATIVTVTATAAFGNSAELAFQSVTPGGRLTLESGVPVSASDQAAKTTIYYTPYIHNIINLWDGSEWVPTTFAETTEALGTLTSGLPYDVFGFLSSGVLDLEKLAWTSITARATAVTLQDGRYCKSGDKTRLYLGTFYTTSTTTAEDSASKRLLFNAYNRVQRPVRVWETSASWSYASTAWRSANNSAANRIEIMSGLADSRISLGLQVVTQPGISGGSAQVAIGEDTTSSVMSEFVGRYVMSNNTAIALIVIGGGLASKMPSAGYHYYQWVESSEVGTTTFYGLSASSPPRHVSGISGEFAA